LSEEEEDEVESDGVSLGRCNAFWVISSRELIRPLAVTTNLPSPPLSLHLHVDHRCNTYNAYLDGYTATSPSNTIGNYHPIPSHLSLISVATTINRIPSTHIPFISTSISTSTSDLIARLKSTIVRQPLGSRHTDPIAFTLSPYFNLDDDEHPLHTDHYNHGLRTTTTITTGIKPQPQLPSYPYPYPNPRSRSRK
jgi:hypothetical protein